MKIIGAEIFIFTFFEKFLAQLLTTACFFAKSLINAIYYHTWNRIFLR